MLELFWIDGIAPNIQARIESDGMSFQNKSHLLIAIVIASLLIGLLRTPVLNGSFAAIVVTVIFQVYLPGYLLARALGRHVSPHPIVRFVWVLTCGLALTICLGAIARLLVMSVPTYLLILHTVMLGLALCTVPTRLEIKDTWQFHWKNLHLYLLVGIASIVVLGVSYESRSRFYGFEDQSIFISLADWIVNPPDSNPVNWPIRTRQIGVTPGDPRMDTDGWTYIQAAWVWTSGVSASQLIWYDLGTLFVWAIPLVHFALAYELIRQERAAAWTAVALVIVGLTTLDSLVYGPQSAVYGRLVLFQINTNRQASLALLLPLALIAGLGYLATLKKEDGLILLLSGMALAATHPIPTSIFVFSIGITAFLMFIDTPNWRTLKQFIPLGAGLAFLLALPFIQRFSFFGLNSAPDLSSLTTPSAANVISSSNILMLPRLPLLGNTYIRNPFSVFYRPAIIVATLAGLLFGLVWRRSLAAKYIFGSTLLLLILFFTPGITQLVDRIGSYITLISFIFILPVSLALGLGAEALINWLQRVLRVGLINVGLCLTSVFTIYILLFEPFPIVASARDQIRALNQMQSMRLLHPSQTAVIESLRSHLPPKAISVFVTPYDLANVIIEEISGSFITGGRDQGVNRASPGDNRFFTNTNPAAPWLDGKDLCFLQQFGVTHIIVLADTTRTTQLLLQPDRFEVLDRPDGYLIFQVRQTITPDAIDGLFEEMNTLYSTSEQARWGRDGFNLILPGNEALWKPIVTRWQAILTDQPDNDRAQLGLAFAYTLMDNDTLAIPIWKGLYERHPDMPLFADALASSMQRVNPSQGSTSPLLESLISDYDAVRTLAARRLLTDTFFYQLDKHQLKQVIDIIQVAPVTWDRLANLGNAAGARKRAALLMGAGEWSAAASTLDSIPYPELSPQDLVAQATLALVRNDVSAALAILKPAADADGRATNVILHPDRWEENPAAWAYYLLEADLAKHENRSADAEYASEQATVFEPKVSQANTQYKSLLSIADTHLLYVMQPEITRDGSEKQLTVTATYSGIRPYKTYPIESWRIQLVSPDSATKYSEVDIPADTVFGALTRVSNRITVPDDVHALTPALVIIEPRYNDAVTTTPLIVPLVLNRPDSALIEPGATKSNYQFASPQGAAISLQAYATAYVDNTLNVTLYWETDADLPEDYQVFVHILDKNGVQVGGQDSAPVNNSYPTSQWRSGVTIIDSHTIHFDKPLSSNDFRVEIGLYRLTDNMRLTVMPTDEQVHDNSIMLLEFNG